MVWPSLDIPPESKSFTSPSTPHDLILISLILMWLAVLISASHLSTLGLEAGEVVRIFPLSATSSTPQHGLPSIKAAKVAKLICLREILSLQSASPLNCPSPSQKQHKDWLSLAAREILGTPVSCVVALMAHSYIVDLKYITSRQVIELSYEGKIRQFTVHSIRPYDLEDKGDLSRAIDALSIASQTHQLWKVDWDCTVSILENHAQTDGRPNGVRLLISEANQRSQRSL